MNWIVVLTIGLALGWVLELVIDLVFWGRRNRRLNAQLNTCRSEYGLSKQALNEANEVVAHYQIKESEFQKCRNEMTDLRSRNEDLALRAETMSQELRTSHQRVSELDRRASQLSDERDQLLETLEDLGRLMESSMHRRVRDDASRQSGILQRSKKKSAAYARGVAATAAGRMSDAAEKVSGRLSTAKARIGGKIGHSQPVHWLKRTHCWAWGVICSVFKTATMPSSCAYDSK